jgi:hypothetical protein
VGADLGRVAGKYWLMRPRLNVQDRGGGLAFEEEFERGPGEFAGRRDRTQGWRLVKIIFLSVEDV